MAAFVPEFEVERVREETDFERVESYPEYPGREHPMAIRLRAAQESTLAMLRALGSNVGGLSSSDGASAVTAGRSAGGAPGRTRSRITSSSGPETCS
jgi:hypothetical protein